jgi:hypothetical protein
MKPDTNGNPRVWEDNQGVSRASYEVISRNIEWLGGRMDATATANAPDLPLEEEEEEVPF